MCKTPLTIDVHVLAEKSYSHNDDDNPAADNDAAFTQRLLQFVNRKKIKLFFTIFFNKIGDKMTLPQIGVVWYRLQLTHRTADTST